MKLATAMLAVALLADALVARAAAGAPAPAPGPKPAPLTTARPPERSLVLTPAQLQKHAEASRPAATHDPAEPAAGVKFPGFSSVVPALPGDTRRAPARAWNVSPSLAKSAGARPLARRAERFPDLVTASPRDPKLAASRADELARKPLTGARSGAQAHEPKLPSFETRGGAPATLSPAQRAKQALADTANARAAERSPR